MPELDLSRYARQTIFPGIGEAGQTKLHQARVAIVGCGATGTVIANHLARAGVGTLRIIDRDFIERHNLQRQLLFDEADWAENLPKAIAAERKLRQINSNITIEGIVADVNAESIEDLVAGFDLIMDGTDNFETRFLINEVAVKHKTPWIYTGAVSGYGMSQTIIPGQTACYQCVVPDMPPPGSVATCDTAGVVGPVVGAMASLSATEALKLIVGQGDLNRGLIHWDLWTLNFEKVLLGPPRPDCPVCGLKKFPFLNEEAGGHSVSLCGRNAVQIRPRGQTALDLSALAQTLAPIAAITAQNAFLLRFEPEANIEITLFSDARAIIKGTDNDVIAKNLYAKYVGS